MRALLILALLASACTDAEAARRRQLKSGVGYLSSEGVDVFGDLTGCIHGWTSASEADPWADVFGDMDLALEAATTRPTCGQSVSGLTGLSSSLESAGGCLIQQASMGGHGEAGNANGSDIADGTDLYFTALIKVGTGGAATTGYLMAMFAGGDDRLEVRIQGDNDIYVDYHGHSTSGTANTWTDVIVEDQWQYVSLIIPDDGAGSEITLCVDGTCAAGANTTPVDYSGAEWSSSVNAGIFGDNANNNVPDDLSMVWMTLCEGAYAETDHDTQCEALGVCS